MAELKEILEEATKLVQENSADENHIDEKTLEKLEELEEAISMSMSIRSREAKMNAAIGAISVSIAKEKNDPIVHKMLKYRKLWKDTKNQIVQKYGAFARQRWMQKQGGGSN